VLSYRRPCTHARRLKRIVRVWRDWAHVVLLVLLYFLWSYKLHWEELYNRKITNVGWKCYRIEYLTAVTTSFAVILFKSDESVFQF